MKKRFFLIFLFLLVAGVLAGYLFRDKPITPSENQEISTQASVSKPQETPAGKKTGLFIIPWFSNSKEESGDKNTDNEELSNMFQADERGNLVLNQNTRHNIEQLYALNTREELDEKLQKISPFLPSTAYRQLVNLIDYFDKYLRDVKNIYPPEVAPSHVEQALEQMQTMHSLRVKHFGSDTAEALFSEDEKTNRQLLELMLKDHDKNATMEEKAERAQKALMQIQSKP